MEAHHLLARTASRSHLLSTNSVARLVLNTRRPGPMLLQQQQQQQQQHRPKSTTNRTKRALNVPPHPSFLATDAASTTIIFNPPPSAASVYHTPFKFLPKSDPRRRANVSALFASSTTLAKNTAAAAAAAALRSSSSSSPPTTTTTGPAAADLEDYSSSSDLDLPPPLHKGNAPRPPLAHRHLTAEQLAELRALRARDPLEWSVQRLARRYGCSPRFVMMAVRPAAAHTAWVREERAQRRARWGPTRTDARDDRRKRREMLYRGEI